MALNLDPQSIAEALRENVELEALGGARGGGAGHGGRRRHRQGEGLPGAMANELLEFPGGVLGMAFNLDEDEIGCIVLGESEHIEEGDPVKQTGRILSVPVGDGFLGRVIDPLGEPLDGKGPIQSRSARTLEVQAPPWSSASR